MYLIRKKTCKRKDDSKTDYNRKKFMQKVW